METKYVENLYTILDTGIKAKASDIHLTNKLVPTLRIDGELRKLGGFEVHTPEILATYVKEILNEEQMEDYEEDKEADLSISYGDVRFRVHIYRQSESDAIALRTIPTKIPSFEHEPG